MEFEKVIHMRRALRALDHIEITEEFIRDVTLLASRSPSCGNKQSWRFVFVKDKNQLELLHVALSGGNYWAKDASMLIAVFSKPELDCMIEERNYYLFDTGMATNQLMLAIVNRGLVAHAMAGFNEKVAKEVLNISEDMRLITIIAVGKHSANPESKLSDKHLEVEKIISDRKNFEEFAYIDSVSHSL
ncbi:MAG: nitroreductase family protein [Candidatus Heimdallarchaeota archaeon]|nr:nitroreductase family protein [Candidatus Heimdallarchaeota archaeon]